MQTFASARIQSLAVNGPLFSCLAIPIM